jgi:hypothetical protein
MQTIRVLEKTGQDGTLHLSIPLGKPNAAFEVVVIVQPQETLALPETPDARGWPPGYFAPRSMVLSARISACRLMMPRRWRACADSPPS